VTEKKIVAWNFVMLLLCAGFVRAEPPKKIKDFADRVGLRTHQQKLASRDRECLVLDGWSLCPSEAI